MYHCITVSPYINSRVVLTHRLPGAQKKNITDDIDSIDTSWCFWIPKHLNTIKHPKIRGLWLLWESSENPRYFGVISYGIVSTPSPWHRLSTWPNLTASWYSTVEMCSHWGLNGFIFWMVYIYKHILFHGGWNMMDTHTHTPTNWNSLAVGQN